MMRMVNLLALAAALVAYTSVAAGVTDAVEVAAPARKLQVRNCGSVTVPACARAGNRDIVFLLDASESIDVDNFHGPMLDFIQSAFCAYDGASLNRAALVTFAGTIQTRINLASYTAPQWFDAIDAIRNDPSMCCSCCTPTAEAFDYARNLLSTNLPSDPTTVRHVLVVSDGYPWQNTYGPYSVKSQGPATYRYITVPKSATLLKQGNGDFPVLLIFLGVPDKWGHSPDTGYITGQSLPGTKRCITRRRKKQCVKIPNNPNSNFPITSSASDVLISANFDVQSLIDLVDVSLCKVTIVPTKSPTVPTTHSPTIITKTPTTWTPTTLAKRFDGLDLYIFLDHSRSMRWRYQNCLAAPGADPTWHKNSACWNLFLGFARMLGEKSSQLPPLWPGSPAGSHIGWQDDYADKTKGLRVWLYGFACADNQKTPLVFQFGERLTNWNAFNSAILNATTVLPDGGTCPSAAFERALGMVQANDLLTRPFKAGILFTDGVFYDQPKPVDVSKGFPALGVLTYAMGIAIPDNGNNNGLKPSEIQDQKVELLAFVNQDDTRLVNFGAEGYNALATVADGFVNRLPYDSEANYPRILDKPYWCGFTTNERCLNQNPETFRSYLYCKWIPNDWSNFAGAGTCMDKTWCGWGTKSSCNMDSYCHWNGNTCVYVSG